MSSVRYSTIQYSLQYSTRCNAMQQRCVRQRSIILHYLVYMLFYSRQLDMTAIRVFLGYICYLP